MSGSYPNAWPGWEKQVLAAIGAPQTAQNVSFLASWHAYEGSNASNNPLNVTAYAPIPVTVGTVINGGGPAAHAGVQSYSSSAQGVGATAAFLQMPNYTSILAALKSGNPSAYIVKDPTVVGQIQKWGSGTFANHITQALGQGPGGLSGALNSITGTIGNAIGSGANAAGSVGVATIPVVGPILSAGTLLGDVAQLGNTGNVASGVMSWLGLEVPIAMLYAVLTIAALALMFLGLNRAAGGAPSSAIKTTAKIGAVAA